MSHYQRPFRYHAVDLDRDLLLGTFESQLEATNAILVAGEEIHLGPGETHEFAVRIEAISSGHTYDVPLQVKGQ
jgi:hypothetical protein